MLLLSLLLLLFLMKMFSYCCSCYWCCPRCWCCCLGNIKCWTEAPCEGSWVCVGGGVGWWGVQSHFRVKPNSVELSWGCAEVELGLWQLLLVKEGLWPDRLRNTVLTQAYHKDVLQVVPENCQGSNLLTTTFTLLSLIKFEEWSHQF